MRTSADLPISNSRSDAPEQAGLTLMEVLVAMILIGIAVTLFARMKENSSSQSADSSKMMRAGQLVEKHIEGIRIGMARDKEANWPPRDTSYSETDLKVTRKVLLARSPKTNKFLPNVRQVTVIVSWGDSRRDSLDVITYVTHRF